MAYGNTFLNETNYKYINALAIFNKISNSYSGLISPPRLLISEERPENNNYIATYFPGISPVIIIDEKVYDICSTY